MEVASASITELVDRRTTAVSDAAERDVDVSEDAIGGFGSPLGYAPFC